MSDLTERTCDACGAAAAPGISLDSRDVHPLCNTCAEWDGEAKNQVELRALVARRAAQPKEVDPRTLPVGAVFRTVDSEERYRVTGSNRCESLDDAWAGGLSKEPVIVLSLPPAEVELGELDIGSEFRWTPGDNYGRMFPDPRVERHVEVSTRVSYRDGKKRNETWLFSDARVLRVPPPSSAYVPDVDDERPEPMKAERTVAASARRICGGVGRASDPCPGCNLCRAAKPKPVVNRWPNTPVEHHSRLDAQLAQQVASGGQSCKAAWSLIERADRVRREEQARSNHVPIEWLSPDRYHATRSGIASLRLERPLIAWKRRV